MRQIFLVRHGPVAVLGGMIYGSEALLSSQTPREAFDVVARRLPPEAGWISSHYPRAVETAQKLRACSGAVSDWLCEWLTINPAFAEQDFGSWRGKMAAALCGRDRVFDLIHNKEEGWCKAAPPSGESFDQLVRCVGRGLEDLSTYPCSGAFVVVCHGGTLRAAMVHTGFATPERAMQIPVPYLAVLELETDPVGYGPRRSWQAHLGFDGLNGRVDLNLPSYRPTEASPREPVRKMVESGLIPSG